MLAHKLMIIGLAGYLFSNENWHLPDISSTSYSSHYGGLQSLAHGLTYDPQELQYQVRQLVYEVKLRAYEANQRLSTDMFGLNS